MIGPLTIFNSYHLLGLNPWWTTTFATICFALYLFRVRIPRWLFWILIPVLMGAHIFEFGRLYGRFSSSSLIVCAAALKLFEQRGSRDFFALCIANYFLIAFVLLEKSDILTTLQMFISFSLIAALQFGQIGQIDFKRLIRIAAITLAMSAPLAAFLFVLVPQFRLNIPALTQETAQSGFSANLQPGQITQLALSNQLVFQARFADLRHLPDKENLYWRGLVMTRSAGLEWTPGPSVKTVPNLFSNADYTLLFPADKQRWLYTLRGTRSVLLEGKRQQHFQQHYYKSSKKRQVRARYQAQLGPQDPNPPTPQDTSVSGNHPRTQALAVQMKATSTDQSVRNIINWILQSRFTYTLSPPAVTSVDEFLFDSKTGFCEHFAASTGVLMRLASVPTRIVLGFQGGDIVEDFVTVRYRDAHAWLEFWSDETQDWVLFDPTSLVANERISLGALGYQNQGSWDLYGWLDGSWNRLESYWYRYVLSLDADRQWNLLANHPGLMIALVLLMIATGFAYSALLGLKRFAPHHLAYNLLSRSWGRHPQEGPRTWSMRLSGARREIVLDYEKLEYAPSSSLRKLLWSTRALLGFLIMR